MLFQELLPLFEGHAALCLETASLGERAKEHPRPLAQRVSAALECGGVGLPGAQHSFHIAHQLFYPHIAKADAEITRRYIFELVRLVEDHCRRFRQHPRVRSAP